ncbi:MAG: hypothetical protein AAF628_22825 [Planctomycetota bacterium]
MPRPRTIAFACALGAAHLTGQAAPLPAALEMRAKLRHALAKHLTAMRDGELEPIRVGNETLPPDRVRREIVFLAGEQVVRMKIGELLIERWRRSPPDRAMPETFDPLPDRPSAPLARRLAAQTRRFDAVFIGGPPSTWPEPSQRVLQELRIGSRSVWDIVVRDRDGGLHGGGQLPPFWKKLVRRWIRKQAIGEAGVRYPSAGLPDGVALRVGDRDWRTADAFADVLRHIHPQDLERALTTAVLREALRHALLARGHWMNDNDFRERFDRERHEATNTPFTLDVVATALKGFPSLEAYTTHWRLLRSFEVMIQAEIDDAALAGHADRFAASHGDGWVTLALVRVSRAQGHGEPRADTQEPDEEQGTRALQRTSLRNLREALGENEFTDATRGWSLADHLFFAAPVGRWIGPLPAPGGHYLGIVSERSINSSTTATDPRTRARLREHYVQQRFGAWANEVAQTAVVR